MSWVVDLVSYGPFGVFGPDDIIDVFGDSVEICFNIDEMNLQTDMVFFSRAEEYWWTHCMKYYPDTQDSFPVEPYYLCGITMFKDDAGNLRQNTVGLSRYHSRPYKAWSFVCVDVEGMQNGFMITKTCCHELGHQFANLTHLCKKDANDCWYWDTDNHNDDDCLMGQGDEAICTGADLLFYIHFCDSCMHRIWRQAN